MKFKKSTLFIFSLIVLFGCVLNNFKNTDEYFDIANQKLKHYNIKKRDYVVIIDYRKNLTSNRLYLLDMVNHKVILNCRVTHAFNSGFLYANEYSNIHNTKKSSFGGYISKHPKQGKYGYSMVISGLDKGINSNAEKRAIIFHPTKYPWSYGCFATSESNNKLIINHIKNGHLIYVIK